jgi:hypothetical protein
MSAIERICLVQRRRTTLVNFIALLQKLCDSRPTDRPDYRAAERPSPAAQPVFWLTSEGPSLKEPALSTGVMLVF